MAFFGLFKKKDDFDDLIKEPLGEDPLLGAPGSEPPIGGGGGGDLGVMDLPSQGMGDNPSEFNGSPDSLGSSNTSASTLSLGAQPSMREDTLRTQTQMPQETMPQNDASSNTVAYQKDFELIITKLDLLKSTLQNMDSRLSNIEEKVYEEKRRDRW
ncbi:hypothetical protein GOV05_04360 [Candidatus Woesearchaeota archaeon]|nr:hypothetical protein [Candidatus Woesearchaeota archaeon]